MANPPYMFRDDGRLEERSCTSALVRRRRQQARFRSPLVLCRGNFRGPAGAYLRKCSRAVNNEDGREAPARNYISPQVTLRLVFCDRVRTGGGATFVRPEAKILVAPSEITSNTRYLFG